jgi:hypothetical protein
MSDYQDIKALSAGFIWDFDSECPFKAWFSSPWNELRERVNAPHFDIGSAAHLAVLEPHLLADRIVAHGHDEYRSNAAKEARDLAYAAGKTPLKPAEWAMIEGMQKAIRAHPLAARLFHGGDAEATLTWEWDGLLCKARPDYLSGNRSIILDLKTTTTVNPRAIARKAYNDGWFVRAAWYLGGAKAALGAMPDKYLFVIAEVKPPHLIEIYEMDDRALIYGDQIIMRTLKRAAECLATDRWPGYGDGGIAKLALPSWAEFQRAEREEAGEFDE